MPTSALRSGSLTGLIITSSDDCDEGELTVSVYKNSGYAGQDGGGVLTANLNNTPGSTSREVVLQAKDVDTFAAGDELYLRYSTTNDWSPSANIRCAIEIED